MKSLGRHRPAIISEKPKVQTGLLVLPVEIRRLVFDHLIGGPGVCIDENGRCAIGKEVPTDYRTAGASRLVTCDHGHGPIDRRIDVLYLMLVCQQL